MNLFTNLSRKAVAKRFALLFLTLIAFGFKANAQVPTFDEILKQYYNTDNIVFKSAERATPYGQQFQNYTFEEWETVSDSYVEPKNWNSFMTAEAKSNTLKKYLQNQISQSGEKRPGTTGSYSARIFSTGTNILITTIIANGNLTTGRIYAGSTTPNNDGNYNFTKRDDSNFNTPLTTIPDSLTVWVAFKPKNASKGNARITTTIHGDTDMKQLAKSGDSPANMVCATANQEIASTSTSAVVWKRVTIPFTAGSHNDPRYILTTFNTNATPGGGSSGDELYVDDICLIYNPSLEMDYLAQTEFQYSGNGVTMNIDVPFTLSGSMSTYNLNKAANEVIAQLSDANGSFANPIELGRMTTDVSGTISGVIPADLAASTGYKVRVVSTNYPMTSNETNVTISYPYVPVPQVEIALGNIAAKSASATFTPNVDCAQYYFLIANATESVNAAYVKANGTSKTSSFSMTWENLTSNTDYAIYVLPLTSDGVEGELAKVTLKTVALVPQITIAKGNVATKSVEATFTPNADCAQYYFLISTEAVDAAYVKANGQEKSGEFTATFENLISNTNYRVYALPIDVEGKEGELKSLNITTASFVPQIEIARDNFTSKTITTTFTPNGDCAQYYFLVALATETVDAAYIKANGENQTETYTTTFEGLTSNTAYTIYALPVDVDGFYGEIKSVTVTTKALAPQIEIAQGEVATKSAAATFTPNADCVEYYFLIAKATETVDAAYVKENGVAKTETFATTFEDLISNTDYVIYALPIDVEGTAGALATLAVTTNAFTPQVDIERGNFSAKSITATFTPNADCAEYYFLISTETVDAEYIKANGEKQTESHTTTFEGLTSNTAYVIYALPVDVDGFNGEIKSITVTTKALVPQVEITKGEVLTYSISASFAQNEDCTQYYFLIAQSTETVDAEYIMANGELKSESYAHTWENLMSNTNYTIYALPIDIEGNAGEVNTLVVKTKVEAGVSEVDIDVEKLDETTVTITATPNENTVLYHYIIVTKAEADAMGEEALMEKLNENENYLDSIADVYTMTVESNVVYCVVAQGQNRDGEWGEVTRYEFVVAGPAAVAIDVEKLTETSVEVTVTPNENVASYQYIVIEKAEADAMGEEALMQRLAEENHLTGVDVWTYTVKSNVDYYVIAQAKNADGRLGEIAKVEFVLAGPATVAIDVIEMTATSVFVMTPNEDAVAYHYIVITKAEADAMGEEALMQKLNENEEYLEGIKVRELVVESNVAYYIVARAKNADGMWGVATIVEYIFEEAGPAVVAIEVKEVSETSVEVTATPNENTVSYQYIVIEKAEADAMDAEALMQKLEESNDLDAVDTWTYTVKSNVEYYVIAQGKNADGKLGELTKVEFVVRVAGPAALTVTVEEFTETSVLVITPNENTVAYHYIIIAKSEADSIGEDAVMQRLNENEDYLEGVTVEELIVEPNVEHYVIAQAKNSDEVWGEVVKVEFIVIEENNGEDEGDNGEDVAEFDEAMFEIYPNPASEYVRIASDVEIESLMIFSLDGKMVYSEDVNQEETMIDVTGFAKGSYIVRMVSNDKFVVRRIIVK